jgi:hypothetical protein
MALGYENGFDGNGLIGQEGNFSDNGGFAVTYADVWYSGFGDGYNEFGN